MAVVIQMTKPLAERGPIEVPAGVALRSFQPEHDVHGWLALRDRAFAREKVGVRQWTAADFETEFHTRPWWSPERMWIAEAVEGCHRELVGSVTLAMRGEGPDARPVVHWLAVDARFRRRGIGRALMQMLETAAWDAGYRQVWLETHAAWKGAVGLYRQLGYLEVLGA